MIRCRLQSKHSVHLTPECSIIIIEHLTINSIIVNSYLLDTFFSLNMLVIMNLSNVK